MAHCFTEHEIKDLEELENLLISKCIPHIKGEDVCQDYQKGYCEYGPYCSKIHCKAPLRMKSIVCLDNWLLNIPCDCGNMHSSFYEETLSDVVMKRMKFLRKMLY